MKLQHFENMSVEEMINEAIDRELSMLAYYRTAGACCGDAASNFFTKCCSDQERRIVALEQLLVEIEEMRQVTESMAD